SSLRRGHLLTPRAPRSPLFPYTTLFRSDHIPQGQVGLERAAGSDPDQTLHAVLGHKLSGIDGSRGDTHPRSHDRHRNSLVAPGRSEEHTSELQSRENLVCRLLLEKKKTK